MSNAFPKALPHQDIEEILPDIFRVAGTMKVAPLVSFGRNMIVVRQGDSLTLINTVRLSEAGLARLDELGKVENVVKLGFYHDRDDPFYVDRYKARFWALPGHEHNMGLRADVEMSAGGELPIDGASLFVFASTAKPEAVLHIPRDGGVLVCCDALQHWPEPGFGTSFVGKRMMRRMGFFKPANVGPMWLKFMKPQADDFARLQALDYQHVLGAHGSVCLNTARDAFGATFKRLFDI